MKKHNHLIKLAALVILVFTAVFFSSCVSRLFSKLSSGLSPGLSREECLQDFEENYKPQIIDHFTENEEVFNKIAETLNAFVAGADDIDSYNTISLGSYKSQNDNGEIVKYTLFTARRLNPDDKNDITREHIDFLNDSTINIYDLKKEDLDKVFMGDDYDPNTGMIRYREAKCHALSYEEYRGNSVEFIPAIAQMYNKADRVEAILWYSKSVIPHDSENRINDHWNIVYSIYWSPAI